jgi:hypothetical protein
VSVVATGIVFVAGLYFKEEQSKRDTQLLEMRQEIQQLLTSSKHQ